MTPACTHVNCNPLCATLRWCPQTHPAECPDLKQRACRKLNKGRQRVHLHTQGLCAYSVFHTLTCCLSQAAVRNHKEAESGGGGSELHPPPVSLQLCMMVHTTHTSAPHLHNRHHTNKPRQCVRFKGHNTRTPLSLTRHAHDQVQPMCRAGCGSICTSSTINAPAAQQRLRCLSC